MVTPIHKPPNGGYIVVANSTHASVLNRPQAARTRHLDKDSGELAKWTNDGSTLHYIDREPKLGLTLWFC